MKHLRVILGDGGAAVLAGVSVLHVYWAAGGRRGQHTVVPTSGGRPLLATSTAATVAVAAALGTASGLYLGATARWQPRWVYRVGAKGTATVLVARAIGDRRYVGFLKRSRTRRSPGATRTSIRRCALSSPSPAQPPRRDAARGPSSSTLARRRECA